MMFAPVSVRRLKIESGRAAMRLRLVPEEDRHQHGRGGEDADRLRRGPADPVRLREREDEQHEAPGHGDRTK